MAGTGARPGRLHGFFERIAEDRILEAIEAGLFDNLKGKGRPLNLEDDNHHPAGAEDGLQDPEERRLPAAGAGIGKEIVTLQELVASMEDEAEKLLQMRRLNFLQMKMGMLRPVSRRILI